MKIVTRFPPSPTGYLHIGSARTALFNWLYAKRHSGRFILRIEDTDRERSTDAAVEVIIDGLRWLGLDWDEGPYFQTQRFDRYREVIAEMLRAGTAYHCYCSKERLESLREAQMAQKLKPRYDGHCRDCSEPGPAGVAPVVRFRNPQGGEVVIDDRVRGEVRISNDELDDLIIARADGTPTYHLTVVVDDIDMGVTHVIRGDDHLNNTPRQINIIEALGAPRPVYAHLPMINGTDGRKLSKRHGAISVLEYRNAGILPESLLNYLARLGWSHGDQEIFSRDEMIALFDIDAVNKAPANFDLDKLMWVNQQYLQQMSEADLARAARPYFHEAGIDLAAGPDLNALVSVQRDRVRNLVDLVERSLFFYRDFGDFDEQAAKKHLRPVAFEPLRQVRAALESVTDWHEPALLAAIHGVAERMNEPIGKVAQPLRVAITGAAASPGIDQTLALVGRERTLARIDRALDYVRVRGAVA
ncbi:MAG: glutamate--tRNA ligase [Gammaproteobacteria bacterium]|nr:glutamate--tRNA ligase [Gammaproteobacteria bacterium]